MEETQWRNAGQRDPKSGNLVLSVKKEAKLSASEVTEVEEGKGDEDLRCSNLFTVCQRRRGFSDDEETKCEQDCFYQLRESVCDSGCREI